MSNSKFYQIYKIKANISNQIIARKSEYWHIFENPGRGDQLELLPEIENLYDLGYVSKSICVSYEDIERNMATPPKEYDKKTLLNIYDRNRQE